MFGVMAMLILTGTHVAMIDFYRCFDVNRSFDGIQTFVPYDRFITLDRYQPTGFDQCQLASFHKSDLSLRSNHWTGNDSTL